ncbi:hypothetical protein LSTR_LSTR017353 [Laodelphax striatellus]|nr:hypothetical protein LSTR_LSTR017353 [Laodelphax striatellus]
MRRIQHAFNQNEEANGGAATLDRVVSQSAPPPPEYSAVLVEINRSSTGGASSEPHVPQMTSSDLTACEVATILRSSFRRAVRDSSSSEQLVDAALPISRDSVIIGQHKPNNEP